jgi:hypothetical protein
MSGTAPVLAYEFSGTIWSYKNPSRVYFVTLPKSMSEGILDLIGIKLNPWGTVPVRASIGDFAWDSSVFPRPDRGEYDLPLNGQVRKRLGLEDGQHITVNIAITLPW